MAMTVNERTRRYRERLKREGKLRSWESPFGSEWQREVDGTLDLTPWEDIRQIWNFLSGESLGVDRVRQIGRTAENKLRPLLEGMLDAG
jgi:hypothetical protein